MTGLHELIISPFQDIVDKGRVAVQNAKDEQPMLKVAQSLVREGERALKKLEPLCRQGLLDYGEVFVHAVRANNDISTYRTELDDLLWDFDECVDANGFDHDRFTQLQALSRKAAPKIVDILRRMDLPPSLDHSALSPPNSPFSDYSISSRLSGQMPRAGGVTSECDGRSLRESVGSSHGASDHIGSSQVPISPPQGQPLRRSRASATRPGSRSEGLARETEEKPPRPPSANPWDIVSSPEPPHDENDGKFREFERRPTVGTNGSESPVDPLSPLDLKPEVRPLSLDSGYSANGEHQDADATQPTFKSNTYTIFPPHTSRHRPSTVSSMLVPSIPEEETLKPITKPGGGKTVHAEDTHSLGSSRQFSPPNPYDMSFVDTTNSHKQDDSDKPATGIEQSANSSSDKTTDRPELQRKPVPPTNARTASPGLEPVHPPEVDFGPIPVESEQAERKPGVFVSSRDCVISTSSSFYLNKGFCEGAHQVLSGRIGVKKVKKPGFTTAATVARCTGCLYELDFAEIEHDVNRLDRGTYTRHGVAYRLRFLQKCHLPTKRIDDTMYGCIFCVHQGRTLDESDATVFFSSKSLLAHLARHPRRLPEVAGLTVIEELEVPVEHANDFDLHFRSPPKPHPVKTLAIDIAQLPSGVAKEQVRKLYGQRLLPDKSAAHEVAQGARLTGITWPFKYEGEWIFAWHDGVFASIPSNIIRLDPPQTGDVKLGGTSHVRAKARWKFTMKERDRGDWLKFDKGEEISNICWQYPEQWFWTGTNSKGKWGVFPQAFIDTNTVQETSAVIDRVNSLAEEKNRPSGVFGRRRFGSSAKKASGHAAKMAEAESRRSSSAMTHSSFSSA